MTDPVPTIANENLGPDEEILWHGPSRQKGMHLGLLVTAALLAATCLWLGWSDASPFVGWSPLASRILGTLFALPLGAFAGLLLLDRLNAATSLLTNERILNINKSGKISPETGYPYDFSKDCRITHRGRLCDLDIPTLVIESGYPEVYGLGGLEPDVATGLVETFNGLKSRRVDRRSVQ